MRPGKRRLRIMAERRLNLTRTRLVLLAGRSLKMAALIVVEESTDILRLRLQLELARVEKERVRAEQQMMRERVEIGFQGEEMRNSGAFASKSLSEIKF